MSVFKTYGPDDEHDAIQESAFRIPPVVESQELSDGWHVVTEKSDSDERRGMPYRKMEALRDALIEARACYSEGFPLAAGRVLLAAVGAFLEQS